MNLGNVLKGQKRLDDAVACYERVIAIHPRSSRRITTSRTYWPSRKNGTRRRSPMSGRFLSSRFAQASNNLGIVLAAQGNSDAAVSRYRVPIALDPNLVEAYVNLGKVLAEQGRLDDATGTIDRRSV